MNLEIDLDTGGGFYDFSDNPYLGSIESTDELMILHPGNAKQRILRLLDGKRIYQSRQEMRVLYDHINGEDPNHEIWMRIF